MLQNTWAYRRTSCTTTCYRSTTSKPELQIHNLLIPKFRVLSLVVNIVKSPESHGFEKSKAGNNSMDKKLVLHMKQPDFSCENVFEKQSIMKKVLDIFKVYISLIDQKFLQSQMAKIDWGDIWIDWIHLDRLIQIVQNEKKSDCCKNSMNLYGGTVQKRLQTSMIVRIEGCL